VSLLVLCRGPRRCGNSAKRHFFCQESRLSGKLQGRFYFIFAVPISSVVYQVWNDFLFNGIRLFPYLVAAALSPLPGVTFLRASFCPHRLSGLATFIRTSPFSVAMVYGAGQLPMTEEMEPIPEDPYGISKLAVELDLKAAHEMFGLNSVVFRPHNVYGERQNIADRYRNVIGIFMNQALQDRPLPVFGDGKQTRAFSHIDDVAPLIAQVPEVPQAQNEVFNVGADTPYSILELAKEISRAFKKPLKPEHLPPRNEVVHAFSDHSKARRIFGATKTVTLREGIGKMAEWVLSKGSATPVWFNDIEIEKKLPPSWRRDANIH
jgi:NAD dependent epimerase/dehydratase family